MTLVHVALISVPSPSLSELLSDWQFNRAEAAVAHQPRERRQLAGLAEITLTSAEMKSLECVSCWFNRDEVVGAEIVDHRLLLGE